MLKRNATIAGIMTIALCTSLVNTNVAFATTRKADEGSNFSSDDKSTSSINTDEAVTTWTAGTNFDSDKKCTINNIIFTDTSDGTGTNNTVSVSGNSLSEVSEVKLPNSIKVDGKEYSITSIGKEAFNKCKGLTSIIIPGSVTSIGENAFYCCDELTGIAIPDSVKSIGKFAFYNCSKLTSITIPDGVTSIEEEAFQGCDGLTSISIPNSVTSIGKHAFDGCGKLTSVTIPNGVKSIEQGAFYSSGLRSITIPNSVTSIDRYAFYNCGLTSITIPESITSIEESTFERCNGLTSVTIPNSVTSIGEKAFYGCNGLRSLTLPDSVTSVGEKACGDSNINIIKASELTMKELEISGFNKVYFYDEDNSKLGAGYVKMWMSVEGLIENPTKSGKNFKQWVNKDDAASKSTFDNVINKTNFKATYEEATVPTVTWDHDKKCTINNIKYTDTSAGNNYTVCVSGNSLSEVSEVKLPNVINVDGKEYNVTSVGEKAFYNCNQLTSITLPDGVTSIEGEAFAGCEKLTSIKIPNSVTSIKGRAFDGCNVLTSITIPEGLTSIEGSAFYGCGITSMTIPNNVTSIGIYAFYDCCNLKSITIPSSVTSIEEAAFYRCNGLTSIEIPNSVKSIGEKAFYDCNGLKSLTIPNSVTSIGNDACTGSNINIIKASESTMKELEIPGFNKVYFYDEDNSKLGAGYVKMWMSVEGLIENPTKTGKVFKGWVNKDDAASKSTFDNVIKETNFKATYKEATATWDSDKKCTINNIKYTDTSTGNNNTVSVSGNSLSEGSVVELPNAINVDGKEYSVTSVGEKAFYNCELTSITIPEGVTSIEENAFQGCEELESIKIPDSVTSIKGHAFDSCNVLTSIIIPEGVTSIEGSAFYGCGITSMIIPNKVTSIGRYAFYDCCNLKSITISENVTSIEEAAFYRCNGLTSIEIPNKVKNIGEKAFYDCNGLKSLTIPDSVTSIGNDACTGSNINIIKASESTMDKLKIPGFNKVYFYDEDDSKLGAGYVKNYMTAEGLIENPTKTGKYLKQWVNKDDATSKSTFDNVIKETNFKATYSDEVKTNIKDKIKETLDSMSVNNDTTEDYIINKIATSAGITVTISNFNKEKATDDTNGYVEGTVNAEENDGSAIAVSFKKVIDKLSNDSSNIENIIRETLDNMSVDNNTTKNDIINKVTTSAGVTVTISDFNKKKATEDKNGYIEGAVNAEEKDGSEISVCFRKVISKLSSESGNSELEDSIKQTLDNMSVNNNTTKDEIIDTITQVTTGSAVKVTISGFNKEKATEDRNGYIEGTVNAEEKDGSDIDVYFKKIISKLSNNSSNHHKHKSSSSSGSRSTSKETTGNGASVQPTNKEKDLGSMLKTTNDNKVVSTNSWGDKNLSGTVSNVVDKNGDYVGSMITSSESGMAKLPIGYNDSKDLKYIYQYDATTKLFIKVPAVVTVDGENIALPVNKDQTYYVTKDPAADNLLLKEGWNTINGSTYRVEGLELKTGWVLENNTWHYMDETSKVRVENNWNLVNNKWYAFNEKGEMKTGWHYNGGSWYFLDTTNGDMKTGWKQEGDTWYNLDSNGAMSTGWKKVDDSWYYLNSNGSMASNTEIDGYALGANGALIS